MKGMLAGTCGDAARAVDTPLEAAWYPSPNFEPRRNGVTPTILLLHYTGLETAERAMLWLCTAESRVSCHYLIDEAGLIIQMVREEFRAWEAHFEGDAAASAVLSGIFHELTGPEIQEKYDLTKKQYLAAVLRIRRRADRLGGNRG